MRYDKKVFQIRLFFNSSIFYAIGTLNLLHIFVYQIPQESFVWYLVNKFISKIER